LSLYASHLPLDANATLGHNAIICQQLDLTEVEPFAEYAGYKIGFKGVLPEVLTLDQFKAKLNETLSTECISVGSGDLIRKIGVVSGGAADAISEAAYEDLDALVTGEFAHQHVHLVQELEIPLIAAGHYKTEVPGIKGLQKLVEKEFGLETEFIDLPTGY
ncbi:MAG: Nif3-like dinuclear metal center hexameric protein, partial [Lentisphaeria bacterium]|nr:Nif3-like dinuclear metal center hexameric protein [Lentisphaeria bacterium]